MSGFSADWLALREPADHAARSGAVAAALAGHWRDRDTVRVVDLGCGAGSNLRATAPLLPARQAWRLVDWDPALLDVATRRLCDWATQAVAGPDGRTLSRDGLAVRIETLQADLNRDLDRVLDPAPDLVTAAAFFDLVSVSWIETFAEALAARRLPLYTVLTYDGREDWQPSHPLDGRVFEAFHRHQARDKGFGPAAGPGAGQALEDAFRRRGYRVVTGDSPWRLGPGQAELVRELASGIAGAAAEAGGVTATEATGWAEARKGATALVGHVDILAIPGA
jgi:hypothetical protein